MQIRMLALWAAMLKVAVLGAKMGLERFTIARENERILREVLNVFGSLSFLVNNHIGDG